MASLAAGEPVEEKWYQALYEGDCVQIIRLLKTKPSLVKVGCSSEPSREVEGRDPCVLACGRSSSTWKGRNALHVAAWRGCVKLIVQVLHLCHFVHSGVDEEEVEAVEGEGSKDSVAPRGIQSDQAESNGAGGSDHNVALDGESPGGVQQNVLEIVSPADVTGLAVSSTRALSEQPIQPSPRPTEPHSKDSDGERSNTSSGFSLSREDLRELLSAEDGFFGLDPFVMAGFHINIDLLVLLGYAYGKSYISDGSGVWEPLWKAARSHYTPTALLDIEDVKSKDRRARLRKATEDVMKTFDDVSLISLLKEMYSTDREYNFLPIEEYFFHFLSTENVFWVGEIINGTAFEREGRWSDGQVIDDTAIQEALWQKVRSVQDVQLWKFLLQLYDGQGRTPFQAAMDRSDEPQEFVKVIEDGCADKREVLVCALTTPDTASRTPAHRAAASVGEIDALRVILDYSKTCEEIAATCHGSGNMAMDIGSYFKAPGCSLSKKQPSEDYFFCLQLTRALLPGGKLSKKKSWEDDFRLDRLPRECYDRFDLHRFPWLGDDHEKEFSRSDKPFHAAMLLKRYDSAEMLLKNYREISYSESCYMSTFLSKSVHAIECDEMMFACLAGADIHCLQRLKKCLDENAIEKKQHQQGSTTYAARIREIMWQKESDWGATQKKQKPSYRAKKFTKKYDKIEGKMKITLKHPWPILHFAACSGNYDLLKFFIDDLQCDAFMEDFEGNTPLHHAMMVREFQVLKPRLLDFVSCEQFKYFQDTREKKKNLSLEVQKIEEKNQIVQRQGCINLLLQAGCDVFKPNKNKQIPYPKGSLISNVEFLSWWYDKQEKEFAATQNNLNFAANATSVTAALVATASYVGPLTPPRGYAGDPNQLQDQNIWVILFIVCDTISFYLAIAAITLSLIPSLPMPEHSMRVELERTRKMVTRAVVVLLPAIVFVFLAFGASSFAVLSDSIISSTAGCLTIATTCIGGLICLATFFSFFMRLMACIFPENTWVRYFYTITSI